MSDSPLLLELQRAVLDTAIKLGRLQVKWETKQAESLDAARAYMQPMQARTPDEYRILAKLRDRAHDLREERNALRTQLDKVEAEVFDTAMEYGRRWSTEHDYMKPQEGQGETNHG